MTTQVELYNEVKQTKLVDISGKEIMPGMVIYSVIPQTGQLIIAMTYLKQNVLWVDQMPLAQVMDSLDVNIIGWAH